MPINNDTLHFLVENRLQNSRTWYNEHKDTCRHLVLEPMMEIVQRLAPVLLKIDPLLVVEPKVDRTISRIYRDTRFTRDKSLYRDVMWCVFSRDRKALPNAPGFFFELSPDGFRYGCGYYRASPKSMEALRELILEQDEAFLRAKDMMDHQTLFQIEGDRYKRPHYPQQPEDLRLWLEQKDIAVIHNSTDFDLLFSDELSHTLAQGFEALAPVYHFFLRAENRASGREVR